MTRKEMAEKMLGYKCENPGLKLLQELVDQYAQVLGMQPTDPFPLILFDTIAGELMGAPEPSDEPAQVTVTIIEETNDSDGAA